MKKEEGIVQKKGVEAVLFDLDGVLVDSFNMWFYVFNDTLKHFGIKELSRKQFRKDFGAPVEHDMKKYFIGRTVKEVKNVYIENFLKRKKYTKLFPQSIEVLKNIRKRKIKLGLITNSTGFIAHNILKYFGLKKYFDTIVTMDDVRRGKPAPDMVLKACKKLKINPLKTILIGDTKNDMIAGKRAGCITVGYKIKWDYKVGSLKDILNIIL